MTVYFIDLEMLSTPSYVDVSRPIAIGIVALEGDFVYKSLINPEKRKLKVHDFTVDLTGITKDQLLAAPNFVEVFQQLQQHIALEEATFVAWGKSDKIVWDNACQKYELDNPVTFIDYQRTIKNQMDITQNLGLQAAKTILHIEEKYAEHDPLDDAKLLKAIYQVIQSNKKEATYLIRKHYYGKELRRLRKRYGDILVGIDKEKQKNLHLPIHIES